MIDEGDLDKLARDLNNNIFLDKAINKRQMVEEVAEDLERDRPIPAVTPSVLQLTKPDDRKLA